MKQAADVFRVGASPRIRLVIQGILDVYIPMSQRYPKELDNRCKERARLRNGDSKPKDFRGWMVRGGRTKASTPHQRCRWVF